MSLTVSEVFRTGIGGKSMKFFNVGHDESTTTLSANLMDFDIVNWAAISFGTQTSAPGANITMTVAANGKTIEFSEILSIGDITPIIVIGT